MTSKTLKKPRKSFGPHRSDVMQAQERRGKSLNNIWQLYSGRLGRDLRCLSDVEYQHLLWLEGDEAIDKYVPQPEPVIVEVDGQPARTQGDALVIRYKARPALHEVKSQEAKLTAREQIQLEAQRRVCALAGWDYVRITPADLEPHMRLIKNWRRAQAFQSSCRTYALGPYVERALKLMTAATQVTLEALLLPFDRSMHTVYIAAICSALQAGLLRSDLHAKPLCAHSLFSLRENPNA